MRNIIVLLFSLMVFEKAFSQTPTVPEWYLNYLFTPRPCGLSPTPIGLPLMWNAEYSRKFLIKKLNGSTRRDKQMAIQYLGMSKDTSFIDFFESLLPSQDQDIASFALRAICSNNSPESIQILENILGARHSDRYETLLIVRRFGNICNYSSIPIINEIIQNTKLYSEKDYKFVNELTCIVEKIEKFNESEEARKQLILDGLNNGKDFFWSTLQISRMKDTSFLEMLRKIQPTLMDLPDFKDEGYVYISNGKYNRILTVRLELGDEQMTVEEQEYVSKNHNLLPLEKRMEFIQQEISMLEPYYKDEYSEGK